MRTLLFVIAGLLSTLAQANQNPTATPAVEKSRFAYYELLPNSDKELTIQSTKCDPKKNDLRIQKFQSESKVTDGTVNVINIYARSGNCKDSAFSSVWHETIQAPKNGKATHIYVTILSDNIMTLL